MVEHCDLIVIGAGPAGSACAEAAATRGLRVHVFDRARFPRTKPCAAGLTSRALHLLGDSIEPVIHRRLDIVEMRLTRRVSGTWRSEHTVVATTTRRELDSFLAERAGAAGARVDLDRSVSDITVSQSGVEVTSAGDRLSAPYAVLAEGAKGRHRCRLGMRPLETGGAAYVRLYPRRGADGVPVASGELYDGILLDAGSRRRGYGWVFPKRDHLNVGVCGLEPPGRGYLRDVDRLVEALGLASWRREGPFAGFVPRSSRPDDLSLGRVLVVGDAAGLVDPVTGEGIAHAVQSGRIAAETVAEAAETADSLTVPDTEADASLAGPAARYRERIAAEVMPHITLLGPLARRLQTVGPGLIGGLLSIRPLADAVERWVPRSPYTAGGTLTIEVRRA